MRLFLGEFKGIFIKALEASNDVEKLLLVTRLHNKNIFLIGIKSTFEPNDVSAPVEIILQLVNPN